MKIGDYLGGYQLVEEVGRGGTAVVYRARQEAAQLNVAIKVLNNVS